MLLFLVAQSCLTLCDSMDCIPPGSSVHGISHARILEWVAISFSSTVFLLLWLPLSNQCQQFASEFGKLSSGHRTRKDHFSFQSQRRAIPKMFKLLHNWSHFTFWKDSAQNLPAMFQQYVKRELLDVKAGFRKGRGTRDQIANIH